MLIVWLCCLVLACPAMAEEEAVPRPPGQPAQGPGGRDYAYERVKISAHGEGPGGYWLFEPTGGADPDERGLPVVLFVHGFNQIHYRPYWFWVRHLVRKGNLVIYPRYQTLGLVDPRAFTQAAADATRAALDKLDGKGHRKADTARFALVGHSLGASIAANLASRYEHYRLPKAGALMAVQPGDTRARRGLGAFFPSVIEDQSKVPAETLMLIVSTEKDYYVDHVVARRLYERTTLVDEADKDLLMIGTDAYGRPALIGDHLLPLAYTTRLGVQRVDAYDFALWRWFDALCAAAYEDGKHRAIALGNTPEQRRIGLWSDGTPIREARVIDPDQLEVGTRAGGAGR